MCLMKIINGIRKLPTPTILFSVNNAFIFSDDCLITLNHSWHLLTLIRVNKKYNFIMSHDAVPYGLFQFCDLKSNSNHPIGEAFLNLKLRRRQGSHLILRKV